MVTYACIACSTPTEITINKSAGYQNLAQHVYTMHKNYGERMATAKSATVVSVAWAVSARAINVFGSLDWIVHSNLPFAFLSTARTRQYSSLKGMSPKTVRKYLSLVSDRIRLGITDNLPDGFGIVFDGWSCQNQHFLAIFASYMNDGQLKTPLLAMAPLHAAYDVASSEPIDIAHGAREHCLFLDSTLASYKRSRADVQYLVCDNCSVNKRLAKDLGVPMVGCASHRLNLAVKMFMDSELKEVVDVVRRLMIKLKTLNNGVRLRSKTPLAPGLHSETRWSSYFAMIKRFHALKPHLVDWETREIRNLLPSLQQEYQLTELLGHLTKLESITKTLQQASISMADVRTLFDDLIEEYPIMRHHLAPDAAIVLSASFEAAVVKAQNGMILSTEEAAELRAFEVKNTQAQTSDAADYATRVLKKARHDRAGLYMEVVRHMPPTSNLVERFFSQAKLVLNPLRQKMLPANFEAVLYLKLNPAYWPLDVVAEIVHDVPEDGATESSDDSEDN